jgi:hypothetical protein
MFNLCIDKSFLLQQTCISSKNQVIKEKEKEQKACIELTIKPHL